MLVNVFLTDFILPPFVFTVNELNSPKIKDWRCANGRKNQGIPRTPGAVASRACGGNRRRSFLGQPLGVWKDNADDQELKADGGAVLLQAR